MFWFSDNGFQKKGKVGRVFIFCFYFQSNMGRIFIFCFYFQRFNIAQTSSILLFWQTNNTIVFTLSTGRIVHGTICLESNCTLKLMRTVFSLVAMALAEFLLSFSIDQSFKCLSKLVRVTGTLENLN
jgi:hypothetical protein